MNKVQKMVALPVLASVMLVGGALASYAGLAAADTATTTTTTSAQAQTATRPFDQSKGGHVGANGTTEVLLTGDQASTATAAALAAVPGATVDRVETDAEGAAYEAHMTKADGSHVTVKFDANFNVIATEDGPNHP